MQSTLFYKLFRKEKEKKTTLNYIFAFPNIIYSRNLIYGIVPKFKMKHE